MSGHLRKWLAGAAAILLLAIVSLFIHMLWVTRPSRDYHAQFQLGRIDFQKTLSRHQMEEAHGAISSIEGIGISKFNRDTTSLIFSFPTGTIPLENIGHRFQQKVSFPVHLYRPEISRETRGCPVTGKNSILYRFSTYLRNTFS